MLRKQFLVAAGIAAGVLVLLLLYGSGVALRFPTPPGDDEAARLAFAARWMLAPALCLFAGVAMTASRRFFIEDAIDGSRVPQSPGLQINLRYNQNTLEQTVLAAIAWSGLALALPHEKLGLIPLLAIFFATGRATFWIGYLVAPWARAFGLVLTFYPTAAALIWLAIRAF
ncbi:MAG: MAPEG family protein [Alphaproteobacteria bacterium]|nr:MAPEG family protein [Alphaproteobacteria bacterium]MBL7099491.1 MAPEG family protein [Alphaproteobacteria bacterium]